MPKAKPASPSARYEKLGSFYLGRMHDLKSGDTLPEPVLYDAKDLTTHAVCVGMTGSGKTGLCVGLLEEAGLDGIPAIVIDPKGDIGNLLLTFPKLRPADFKPWVDAGEAQRKGMSTDEFAADRAKLWKKGLGKWDQDGQRIARLREAVDMTIYTPGSTAGVGLTPLRSFAAPGQAVIDDAEALRDKVISSVSGLLALLGVKADPVQSREHILLSTILERAWRGGRGLDLAGIITQVQTPPFGRVGVLDVESFMPEKQRFALAMKINNLLASPGFASWLDGEPLDIQRLLYTPEGKPRISILSISHLSESERMFFVTIVLGELVAWMRAQPGTTSLRALLYMDEVFGYFPPSAEPPSKRPMLTLMKQARAYGLGVVLATQNPVDLDYKGLSNAGTWFLGRLQTERDKKRVLEGLEGAAASASARFNKKEMGQMLAGLGKRVFLMHNVHEDGPATFHTRWVMSYLRGPLTRTHIADLMEEKREQATIPNEPGAEATGSVQRKPLAATRGSSGLSEASSSAITSPPPTPAGISAGYLPVFGSIPASEALVYHPALLARAQLHFVRVSAKVDEWIDSARLAPLDDPAPSDPWPEAIEIPFDAELMDVPDSRGIFAQLPAKAARKASYKGWSSRFKAHNYRNRARTVLHCKSLKSYSTLGEGEGDFRARLRDLLREKRDESLDKLRRKYAPKVASLESRVRKAEQRVEVEQAQYKTSGIQTAVSFGATILGAVLGRKKVSATSVRRAGTSMSRASRTAKERGDIARAKDNLEDLQVRLDELEKEFESELERVKTEADPAQLEITAITLAPRKTEMGDCAVTLAWVPYAVDANGRTRAVFETA